MGKIFFFLIYEPTVGGAFMEFQAILVLSAHLDSRVAGRIINSILQDFNLSHIYSLTWDDVLRL